MNLCVSQDVLENFKSLLEGASHPGEIEKVRLIHSSNNPNFAQDQLNNSAMANRNERKGPYWTGH